MAELAYAGTLKGAAISAAETCPRQSSIFFSSQPRLVTDASILCKASSKLIMRYTSQYFPGPRQRLLCIDIEDTQMLWVKLLNFLAVDIACIDHFEQCIKLEVIPAHHLVHSWQTAFCIYGVQRLNIFGNVWHCNVIICRFLNHVLDQIQIQQWHITADHKTLGISGSA